MTLQITPPPASRISGIACLRDLHQPEHVGLEDRAPRVGGHHLERKVVALDAGVVDEHAQARRAGASSTGRSRRGGRPGSCRRHRLRRPRPSPSAGLRIVATTSNPRRASSTATARPIPRPAPVTTATPVGFHACAAYERRFGTVPPLGPALHPRAGALPRRRARVARPTGSTGRFAAVRGRGGPGDEHECFDERWAWEQELGRDGWIGLGWPAEHGGRGASLVEQMIFFEEYAAPGGPGRVGIVGEGLLGPTIVHFGSDDAAARGAARHPAGHRDLVPGLLRARRRLRPRQREDPGRARRRRVGHHRPEGVDLARALGPVDLRARAHQPRRAEAQGPLVPPRADAASPASRSGRSCRSPATPSSTRPSSTARAPRPTTSSARSTTAGGSRWARSRSNGARPRSASSSRSSRSSARSPSSPRPTAAPSDPVLRQRLADAWITLRVMRFHALRTLPALEHGTVTPATSIHKLFWATFHRALGELAIDVCGPAGVAGDRRGAARLVPLQPRRHDLRRLEPDPAQRDRGTGARVAEGAEMTNVPVAPDYPPGRGLLAGKTVLVTAAAGNRHRLRDRQALRRGGRAASRSPTSTSAGCASRPSRSACARRCSRT